MTVVTVRRRPSTRLSSSWWIGGLTSALLLSLVVAAGAGQLAVGPGEVVGSILHRLGLDIGSMPSHPNGDAVLWQVRFPRVAMGALVGAALGAAGALMQGLFRNPLAEPAIVGVSSGAAVGACASIVGGVTFLGVLTLPAMAFGAGLLTTLAVYRMSRTNEGADVSSIVLTGIAVNAVAGGLVSFLLFAGDRQAREQIVFWQLGSLNGSRWDAVAAVAGFAAVGFVGCAVFASRLDLLALGERTAGHLGVNVERLRLGAIACVALLVGPAVAFSGIIGFVGLVVAHIMRIVVGPSHRRLVPASALGGAIVLVWADLFARTAVDFADLPIGMLTALIGGPAFFLLLRRARAGAGGWA
ncbi:MAG: iron ABC transporter permease [Acidimicrobiales bacterium]